MISVTKVPAVDNTYREDLRFRMADATQSRVESILRDNGWDKEQITQALDGRGQAELKTPTGKVRFTQID